MWSTDRLERFVQLWTAVYGWDDIDVYYDEDFEDLILWVDVAGKTIENDSRGFEYSDARWNELDGRLAERTWYE